MTQIDNLNKDQIEELILDLVFDGNETTYFPQLDGERYTWHTYTDEVFNGAELIDESEIGRSACKQAHSDNVLNDESLRCILEEETNVCLECATYSGKSTEDVKNWIEKEVKNIGRIRLES